MLIKAKDEGLIESGKEILDQLEQHGFWLSERLRKQLMARVKE